MATRCLWLLGPARVEKIQKAHRETPEDAPGAVPRFRSRRTVGLLGYLAAERRPVARDHLAALFWPDEPASKGRVNVSRELHNLAQILPDCWELPPAASPEEKKREPRWASKGVCYISKHDVYLVTGPTGNDTRVYEVAAGRWADLRGGDIELVNGYCQYEPESDLVVLSYQLKCFRLRYVPQ